jgi:hypothetical protein
MIKILSFSKISFAGRSRGILIGNKIPPIRFRSNDAYKCSFSREDEVQHLCTIYYYRNIQNIKQLNFEKKRALICVMAKMKWYNKVKLERCYAFLA